MVCEVHIYLLNQDFSQEHADANHNGEESERNRRFEWEDQLMVKNVDEISELENAKYKLQGEISTGESFSYEVEGMRLFELTSGDVVVAQIGCSESVLESSKIEKSDMGNKLILYLKDYEPMSNPVTGIYIASQDFPKELINP